MLKHTNKVEGSPPEVCKSCGMRNRSHGIRGNGHGKYYYHLICIACKSKHDRAVANLARAKLKAKDPDAWKLKTRRHSLKRNYNITLEEYQEILTKQKNGCAICGKMESLREMPVDHCHKTGVIRGVLCHWCNKGLGQFFDNPQILRKAADYIESRAEGVL